MMINNDVKVTITLAEYTALIRATERISVLEKCLNDEKRWVSNDDVRTILGIKENKGDNHDN